MLFLAAVLFTIPVSVTAATITTSDGVLSIDTPNDNWKQGSDSSNWFSVTDGTNVITINHFSNGESLPAVEIANSQYAGITESFISTQNEVFVVNGKAVRKEDLATVMSAIGTIKILSYDTKTAVQTPAVNQNKYGMRNIGATYYVKADSLTVRSGYTINDPKLGSLSEGDEVYVIGAVTLYNQDYGWYQIKFGSGTGYASAEYLSPTQTKTNAPVATAPANNSNSQNTSNQKTKQKVLKRKRRVPIRKKPTQIRSSKIQMLKYTRQMEVG